jgi:hypothetical protein
VLAALRVQPAVGRRFNAEDDSPKSPMRVMLAHRYWQRKFNGDASAIGRLLTIDGKPYEIIGVLPKDFRFLDRNPDLFCRCGSIAPSCSSGSSATGHRAAQARRDDRPGERRRRADDSPGRAAFPMPPGFTKQMFDEARIGPNLRPLSQDVIGDVGRALWVIFGTVAIVLLIACANVANLFLVRAEGRQQELAIHAALGAGSRRIAWELSPRGSPSPPLAASPASRSPTPASACSSPLRRTDCRGCRTSAWTGRWSRSPLACRCCRASSSA